MRLAVRIGVPPWRFWRMTFHELTVMIDGHADAAQDSMRRLAQHASWVLSPFAKDGGVSPAMLLGEEVSLSGAQDLDEVNARIADLRERKRRQHA